MVSNATPRPADGVVMQSYSSKSDAEDVVRNLLDADFASDDINILAGDNERIASITDTLIALGVSPEDARHFHDSYDSGDTLVIVAAGEREPDARRILGPGDEQDVLLV